MPRRIVKWRVLQRHLEREGYEIRGSGGDKLIIAPKSSPALRSRNVVRIGHKCCSKPGDQVWPAYLKALERAFSINIDDIKD